jgi:Endonuclease-reverse transcriptase
LAESHNNHVFPLTETWLTPKSTSDAIPHGFTFSSTPRPVPHTCTSSAVGSNTAFLIREPCTLLSSPTNTFKSFEMSTVTLKLPHSKLTLFNIYRPSSSPAKSRNLASFPKFLEDFQTHISSITTISFEFLITADFNIHVDNLTDSNALKFISLLDLANLTQHVPFSTLCHSHTLDLVISTSNSSLSPIFTSSPVFPSDHIPVTYSLNISPSPAVPLCKQITRSIHSINIKSFIYDIMSSNLITHPPTNLSDLVDCYNSALATLLNKHALLKSKIMRPKPANHWFTAALNKLKLTKRHLERVWSKSHSNEDLKLLRTA